MEYTFPDILAPDRSIDAERRLQHYFNEDPEKPTYSGRKFHTLGGQSDPDTFTALDLLALKNALAPSTTCICH